MTAAHCVERERVIKVSLGIRRDGSYQKTVEVNASHLYLYPGFPTNSDKFIDRLYDIGEFQGLAESRNGKSPKLIQFHFVISISFDQIAASGSIWPNDSTS